MFFFLLRDVSALPVKYTSSKNAWMTSNIFTNYLSAWNSSLRFQKRKIVLLLDNCSAHPSDIAFSNIKLIFLPPNTTSTLQPLDIGVIRNFKCHYRSAINKRVIRDLNGKFNGHAAVQSLRTIMSKTRWELRWNSFSFYS